MRLHLLAVLAAAAPGLVAVEKTIFDEAQVKRAASAAARAVILDAPTVAYARRQPPQGPIYRDENWQLGPGDLAHLQKHFLETFREDLAAAGVLRLTPAIVDLRLTAPLHEDTSVNKTFTKSIGDVTLVATIRDAGEIVATLRDARRNVQISAACERGIRFTSTLYRFELRHDFRSWAKATSALFPEKKKPQP